MHRFLKLCLRVVNFISLFDAFLVITFDFFAQLLQNDIAVICIGINK